MAATRTKKQPAPEQTPERVPVLVTTEWRGVFFGYIDAFPETTPAEITLHKAQMATYWSAETHGVFGLAADGPRAGCRIGPPVARKLLNKVTSVTECSPEAVAAWEAQPWTR
jgi:hypothetical protein